MSCDATFVINPRQV